MKKSFFKFFSILIVAAIFFTSQIVSLAAPVDMSAKANLTINFIVNGIPIPGGEFELYRIAEISRSGVVTLTEPFSDYPINFEIQTAQEKRILALSLKGYVISENIEPDFVAVTDINGRAEFKNIPLGMYLAVGKSVTIGDTTYVPDAFVVTLPAEAENETWDYNVNVRTKAIHDNTNIKTNVRVLKVWDDDNDKSTRPDKIVVDLYLGDVLYDSVILNKDNNWHHTWKDLPGIDWTVVERIIPDGYKVSVDRDGFSFVITNSKPSENEEEPDSTTKPGDTTPDATKPGTTGPDSTTKPGSTKPDITKPGTSDPDSTTRPGDVTEDVSGEKPSGGEGETGVTGDSPSDEDTSGKDEQGETPTLPQTGMLWWPVPVMVCFGILFLMLGVVMNRRSEDEN